MITRGREADQFGKEDQIAFDQGFHGDEGR